jgi:inhibitor of cysteine peptidase
MRNKFLVFTVLIFLFLILTGAGCVLKPKEVFPPKQETPSNEEAPVESGVLKIETKVGETFSVVLDANPTTGYDWQGDFDEAFLKLAKKDFKAESELLGAGGKETFEFQALNLGKTQMTFSYLRSWEKGVEPIEKKVYEIEIQPAKATASLDETADWNTYVNDVYEYEIKYPSEATITEAKKDTFGLSEEDQKQGLTFDDVYNQYTGKICVGVRYKLGYIYISAPQNASMRHVTCGRTGVGGPIEEKGEEIAVDGKKYLASGFEETGIGETLNLHNETFVINLDDGTRIEYGSLPGEQATYRDYLVIKDELLKIVESYHKIK